MLVDLFEFLVYEDEIKFVLGLKIVFVGLFWEKNNFIRLKIVIINI